LAKSRDCKNAIKFKSLVSEAIREDVHKGWIRVSEDLRGDIPNGAYVQVIANNNKVCCQVRGTPNEIGCVRIAEWYRNVLGWTEPPSSEIELEIKEVGLLGRINAWSLHPDDIVRVAIALGIISVGLGLLGVILAFLTAADVMGIVSLFVGLALIPIVTLLLFTGSWIFLRRLPRPVKRKDS